MARPHGHRGDGGQNAGGLRGGGRHHPAGPLGRAGGARADRHPLYGAGERLLSPRRAGGAEHGARRAVRRAAPSAGRLSARSARGEVQQRRSAEALWRRGRVRAEGLVRGALAHLAFGQPQRGAVPVARHRADRQLDRPEPGQPDDDVDGLRLQGAGAARLCGGQRRDRSSERPGAVQAGRRGDHHAGLRERRDHPAAARHQSAASLFAGLPGAGGEGAVDGSEPVGPHRGPQSRAPVGGAGGLVRAVRPPAVEAECRDRCQRWSWWHGLVRHPRLRGSIEGQGGDAAGHL
uniref:LigA n=1 Tax=Parastrongyloides trichosuri TaxID=131310 RepID=A0A0N4ZVP5_PARTI